MVAGYPVAMSLGEFDLIARIRARVPQRGDVVLGIGDDAALLQPPPGRQLVVTTDTLNNGVQIPQVGYGVFQVPAEETRPLSQQVVIDRLQSDVTVAEQRSHTRV